MMECFVCDSFLRFVFQDSSKTSRKVSDKWVQTRGYQACVVYMPITPTRLFSESAHSSQTILAYLRKLKKLQRTFDTAPNLKYNFHIE